MTDGFDYVKGSTATASENHSDIPNVGFMGVIMLIDVTAIDTADADETYEFIIQGKDVLSGTYYDILTSGDVAGDGQMLHVLEVHPALTESANERVSRLLPDKFRLRVAIGGTTPSVTYTVRTVLL